MKDVLRSVQAKGVWNFTYRLFVILKRFRFSPNIMKTYLNEYNRILNAYNCQANFFIPARIAYKYRKIIKQYVNSFLLHGDMHIDYSLLPESLQKVQIDHAISIARQIGINTTGFRFPYLRYGKESIKVLSQCGFIYDSSQSILWPVITKLYKIAEFYHPLDPAKYSSLPFLKDGLLEIPVSLPDDEILIDRLKIHDIDNIFSIWKSILELTYAREEIFVLQLHPERISICGEALKRLILEAKTKNPPVWITTLEELSKWWLNPIPKDTKRWPENCRSVFCITGDIDAFNLWDFFKRFL